MERHGGFQMVQAPAESDTQPSESALKSPQRQVAAFRNRRADPVLVRVSIDDLGYDLRDLWWGVVAPENVIRLVWLVFPGPCEQPAQ